MRQLLQRLDPPAPELSRVEQPGPAIRAVPQIVKRRWLRPHECFCRGIGPFSIMPVHLPHTFQNHGTYAPPAMIVHSTRLRIIVATSPPPSNQRRFVCRCFECRSLRINRTHRRGRNVCATRGPCSALLCYSCQIASSPESSPAMSFLPSGVNPTVCTEVSCGRKSSNSPVCTRHSLTPQS